MSSVSKIGIVKKRTADPHFAVVESLKDGQQGAFFVVEPLYLFSCGRDRHLCCPCELLKTLGYIRNMLGHSRFNRRLHRIPELFQVLFEYLAEAAKAKNPNGIYEYSGNARKVVKDIGGVTCVYVNPT